MPLYSTTTRSARSLSGATFPGFSCRQLALTSRRHGCARCRRRTVQGRIPPRLPRIPAVSVVSPSQKRRSFQRLLDEFCLCRPPGSPVKRYTGTSLGICYECSNSSFSACSFSLEPMTQKRPVTAAAPRRDIDSRRGRSRSRANRRLLCIDYALGAEHGAVALASSLECG